MSDTMSPEVGTGTAGYQVVVYPSRAVRPIPSFLFAAPEGWIVDEAPGALLAVRAARPVGEFWDNALLTHERVAKAVDLQAAASVSWGRLKADAPSAEVQMERVASFGGNVVYLRGVELDAPQSGKKLAQVHALFFGPSAETDKTVDLFQLVITSTAEHMDDIGRSVVPMIASFRFT